jgi:acetyl esterase
MALDPAAADLLRQMDEAGLPPLNEMSPVDARVAAEGFVALGGPGDDVAEIVNRTVPGPHGDIPIRIYRPNVAADSTERADALPCLVYFHGGGWVIGTVDSTEAVCKAVANRAGCVVVSVEYRLSPEFKFPIPFDDCYAATEWVAANGKAIGVDSTRIAVGGDSAGGNLAAAVSLKARDESGPALRMQLLVYPVTDHDFSTKSYAENGDGYLLTTDMMKWFWDHYLSSASDGKNPIASPLRASDLSNLPPALVITAEFDPLRDEGEAYATALTAAGVSVTHTRYPGQIHAFWQMLAIFESASKAADQAADELRKAFQS